MKHRIIQIIILALTLLVFNACGGESSEQQTEDSNQTNEQGLTEFELEHGIGPVTEVVELGELDPELAAQGKEVYEAKCTACHKPTERYIGPASNDILDRRSPAYIMNMIMNPDEMTKKHPEGIKMMQEYMSPMPYQNVTIEQARAIVEYFRTLEDENQS
ncbi:MAG: cytochrome c [Balneolaceae bacterium]|nr:cytochrome c [Balneolaceae bacterium]